MKIQWSRYILDFAQRTYVMGVLNVTPDSFSDGGRYLDRQKAVEQAHRLVEEGADIIDIGGESTRPGSDPVTCDEELRRTIPVIEVLAGKLKVPLSIDTYKAAVADQALQAGAAMVNDISGLRFDPAMAGVIARHSVPVVIMHTGGRPKEMQKDPLYRALIPEVMDCLRESCRMAEAAGIAPEKIIVDPGIGFGKTFQHNLEIIHNLREFKTLGRPLLMGVSRKAFIGRILGGLPAGERVEGTAAAVAIAIFNGANIVRVHDVKEMSRVAQVADAITQMKIHEEDLWKS